MYTTFVNFSQYDVKCAPTISLIRVALLVADPRSSVKYPEVEKLPDAVELSANCYTFCPFFVLGGPLGHIWRGSVYIMKLKTVTDVQPILVNAALFPWRLVIHYLSVFNESLAELLDYCGQPPAGFVSSRKVET